MEENINNVIGKSAKMKGSNKSGGFNTTGSPCFFLLSVCCPPQLHDALGTWPYWPKSGRDYLEPPTSM